MVKRIRYYDKEDASYAEYCYEYPDEKELLEVFPEAQEIVPAKIKELTEQREEILENKVRPYLRAVNQLKDKFSRQYWKQAFALCQCGDLEAVEKNLKRLTRLKQVMNGTSGAWEEKKRAGKEKPIVELYDFQKLRQVGRQHVALCPFHKEKTPSFHIFADNCFKCFGCGASGDSFTFVQKLKGFDFKQAVDYLGGGQ